jgi:hypothetical protein
MLKDNSRLMGSMLDKIAKGDRSAALEDALQIIEAQKDNMDELTTGFDRLYEASRSACVHIQALEETLRSLELLYLQARDRRG